MSSEVRVLGATALFTAALVCIAWWLGQHHDDIAQRLHGDEMVTAEPHAFSVGSNTPRTLAVMPTDAGLMSAPDAAADEMSGAEAELAAILIPALCATWMANCLTYPSRFASEVQREVTTTCEQDTLRDFRTWWRGHVEGPAVVVEEPHRARLLSELTSALGDEGPVDLLPYLVRADAVAGEACASGVFCRDGSLCVDRRCRRLRQLGEPCANDNAATIDSCDGQLRCVNERCEPAPVQTAPHECEGCVPVGTPCSEQPDCGDHHCAGAEAERRCDVADDNETEWDFPGAPWNERTRCRDEAWCEIGSACRGSEPDAYGEMTRMECVPLVGEGGRCEHAPCGRRLRCVTHVPEGGVCIAHWCQAPRMLAPRR